MPEYNEVLVRRVWSKVYGRPTGEVLCGVCNNTDIAQLDHCLCRIIPKSNGGTDDVDNLMPVCARCFIDIGETDLRAFTRAIYNRDLIIPKYNQAVIEFVNHQIIRVPGYFLKRKELLSFIKDAFYGMEPSSVGKVCDEIKRVFGVDISTPAIEYVGIAIKINYQNEQEKLAEKRATDLAKQAEKQEEKEAAEVAKKTKQESREKALFDLFIKDTYVMEPDAGSVTFKDFIMQYRSWNKAQGKQCVLTSLQALDRMKKMMKPRNDKEFWNIRLALDGDEISGGGPPVNALLLNMP